MTQAVGGTLPMVRPGFQRIDDFRQSIVSFREAAAFDQGKPGWRSRARTRLLRLLPFYSRYIEGLLKKLTVSMNLLGDVVQEQADCLNALVDRLDGLSIEVRRLREETAVGFPSFDTGSGSKNQAVLSCTDPTFYSRFTMTDEEMLKKFRGYLSLLPPEGPIFDVGAGTGLFLEVCRQAGLEAWGIDSSPAAVAACRKRSLQVELEAVPEFLAQLPANSATCITAFQVIEHLPLKHIYDLLASALRILTPGGRLILETINPESSYAVGLSYRSDPSHRTLIHPRTLAYAVERFGFVQPRVHYAFPLHGVPGASLPPVEHLASSEALRAVLTAVTDHIFGYHDYAVIATKPATPEP